MNDYTMGLIEGMMLAEAIVNKYCDPKDMGPSSDAIDEMDTVVLKLLYSGTQSIKDRIEVAIGGKI